MSVAFSVGQQVRPGTPRSHETFTVTTSTAIQTITPGIDFVTLAQGTATAGPGVNRYLLATDDGLEGFEVIVQTAATGHANLVLTGTATGQLVFLTATDSVLLKQVGGVWRLLANEGATFGTGTGEA